MLLRSYGLAILTSLTLHGALLGVMLTTWNSATDKKTVTQPKFVQAKLVELKQQSKKKAAKKKPKIVDLTARKRELEKKKKLEADKRKRQQRAAEERKRKAEAEKKKNIEREKRKEAEQAAIKEKRRLEELARLEDALREEEGALLEEQYATEAQSYAAAVQKRIEQNWSRPPSARNGMRCELLIEMVPNGRILNVEVSKSSGNLAFDRSALAAVKKVELFPEIKNIPIEIFERHFRKFSLGFQPEDLRQ